jgi:hypothetical protein
MGSSLSQKAHTAHQKNLEIRFPSIITECICDYLLDNNDCKNFLIAVDEDVKKYEYIYNVYTNVSYHSNNIRQLLIFGDEHINIRLPSLIRLECHDDFNSTLSLQTPNLIEIVFGDWYNQEIKEWSSCLTHITFGKHYNKEIKKWPSHITHITIGEYYLEHISSLPECLVEINVHVEYVYLNELVSLVGNKVKTYGSQNYYSLPPLLDLHMLTLGTTNYTPALPPNMQYMGFSFMN